MESKRKLEELDSHEYGNTQKYIRNTYVNNQDSQVIDRFESTHLHRTNKEMAEFVRGSIIIIRKQQEEIDYLKSIVHHLQTK